MRLKNLSFDIVKPFVYAFALWLGFSGRVSWWVISLVALSDFKITFTCKREY